MNYFISGKKLSFINFISLSVVFFFLVLSGLSAGGPESSASVPVASPVDYIAQDFDILHYDADIDLTSAPLMTMSGKCSITFVWKGSPDTSLFYFHLRTLMIDSAFYNGKPCNPVAVGTPDSATYHYETGHFQGKAGDTARLTIYYKGTMSNESEQNVFGGVYSRGTTLFSIGVGFHNNYVSCSQHWLPCYDLPADKATFDFRFKVVTGNTVASNGTLTIEPGNKGTEIYHWHSSIPTATYMFTFAVDKYDTLNLPGADVPIVIYHYPLMTDAAKFAYSLVPDMVNFLESIFGPYPFEKVGYVDVPLPGGAMEHQTMISMPKDNTTALYNAKDNNNTTALHELSHQWFGDAVTCIDFRSAWLSESFATYCEALWAGYHKNHTEYLNELYIDNYRYLNNVALTEGVFPLYDFPRNSPSSNYPTTIYYKGAGVLHLLHHELGSDFFRILKNYVAKFRYTSISTANFKDYVEKESGKDLSWFFNQWVYGKGYPQVAITVNTLPYPDKKYCKAIISVNQQQPSDYGYKGLFDNLPVEFTFKRKDNTKFSRIFSFSGQSDTVVADSLPNIYDVLVNQGDSLRTLMSVQSIILGVDENNSPGNHYLKVYPNPADTEIQADFYLKAGDAVLKIVDLNGEIQKSETIETKEGENSFKFDVNSLGSGYYYIVVEQNNTKMSANFIINR